MDIAERFDQNPLLGPEDMPPSVEGAVVECAFNPGAFTYDGKTYLLVRVAERLEQTPGSISTLVADSSRPEGIRIVSWDLDDPKLDVSDPRFIYYDGHCHLTTLSHLRYAESEDGIHFRLSDRPPMNGASALEAFGIEDVRVTRLGDEYILTYSAVSDNGVGIGLQTTRDWRSFTRHGMIIPPHNKDGVVFDRMIDGRYACLHRPSGADVGGHYMWLATSPDLRHWGHHVCVAKTRNGLWDSQRCGAGAAPILTDAGWLLIYHGADDSSRYCLGAMLLDKDDPTKVIARGDEPIMEPVAEYETTGFFGNVVFCNGQIVDGDRVTIYYGAADLCVCGASFSIEAILDTL